MSWRQTGGKEAKMHIFYRKGLPIYMRSASNIEMWPSLLEKAYAKAKGSYELLNHWLPIDGCIELTGQQESFFLKNLK
jgi:hypothetical protein